MDWLLYDKDLRHEKVNKVNKQWSKMPEISKQEFRC